MTTMTENLATKNKDLPVFTTPDEVYSFMRERHDKSSPWHQPAFLILAIYTFYKCVFDWQPQSAFLYYHLALLFGFSVSSVYNICRYNGGMVTPNISPSITTTVRSFIFFIIVYVFVASQSLERLHYTWTNGFIYILLFALAGSFLGRTVWNLVYFLSNPNKYSEYSKAKDLKSPDVAAGYYFHLFLNNKEAIYNGRVTLCNGYDNLPSAKTVKTQDENDAITRIQTNNEAILKQNNEAQKIIEQEQTGTSSLDNEDVKAKMERIKALKKLREEENK